MKKFKILKGYNNKPFSLTFGSNVNSTTGGSAGHSTTIPNGEILIYDSTANDGKVWFIYKNKRGYTQSGDLKNLLKANIIEPVNENIQKLRNIIREEIAKVLKEESEFEAFYNHKKITLTAKDLWDAKQKAIKQFNVPKSKQGLVAVQSLKSKAQQDFRLESAPPQQHPKENSIWINNKTKQRWQFGMKRGQKYWLYRVEGPGTDVVKIDQFKKDYIPESINEYDNSIYFKPKNLKKTGWIVINARKNDGRPLYDLYDTDDSKWQATHRMGTAKYPESSSMFYTIPIKIEGNKFKILSENEKWSRPYSYEKIEIKGKDY